MATIREDVVQVSFDVNSGPLDSLDAILAPITAGFERLTQTVEAGFMGLGVSAEAFSSDLGNVTAGFDNMEAAAGGMNSVAQGFDAMDDALGNFAGQAEADMGKVAQGTDKAMASAKTFTAQMREMAAGLKEAAATKVGDLANNINSSATAAKNFAASLKAATFDKAVAGAKKLDESMGRLMMGDTGGLKDIARGLDTALGKAATKAGELFGKLKGIRGDSVKEVEENAKDAGSALGDMGKEGQSSAGALSSAFAKAMIGVELLKAGVKAVANVISQSMGSAMNRIDTTEQFGRVMNAMPVVAESAAAAGVSVQQMVGDISAATTAIVTDTAYSLTTAMQGVQGLISRGIDPTTATDAIQALSDATAFYADGSDETFGRVSDAMSKMITSGRASMEQLNTLMEAGIPALDIFADATGMTAEQVRDSLSKGAISAEDFMMTLTDAIETGTSKFPALEGAALEAGATWTGTFDNMKSAVARGTAAILTSLDTMLESEGLPSMRGMLLDTGRAFGDFISVLAGAKKPEDFFASLRERVDGMPDAIAGIGSSIGEMFQRMGEYAPEIGEILGPVVEGLGKGLVSMAGGLVQGLMGLLPVLFDLGLQLLLAMVDGIVEQLPVLLPAAMQAITQLVNGLLANLPMLIQAAVLLVVALVQGLLQQLPTLISTAIYLIIALVQGLLQQLPMLIMTAFQLLMGIVQGLLDNIPMLIDAAVYLVMALVQGLVSMLPLLIQGAIQLVMALVQGILQNLPALIVAGIQIIVAVLVGIIEAIPELIGMIPELFTQIVEAILAVDWLDVGIKIIMAIWDGIKSLAGSIWEGIKRIFTGGDAEDLTPEITVDTTQAATAGATTGAAYTDALNGSMANIQVPDFDMTAIAGADTTLGALGTTVSTTATDFSAFDATTATALAGVGTSMTTLGTDTTTMQAAMSTEMTTITTNVGTMATGIQSKLDELATTLYTSGVNAMEGFNNGIESMRATIMATVASIGDAAATALAGAIELGSPSRLFKQYGVWTGEGYAIGVTESVPMVRAASQELAMAPAGALAPYSGGPAAAPVTNRGGDTQNNSYSPKFTLNIGSGATAGDRDMERQVKSWIVESFNRLMADAQRGAPRKREV